MVGDHLGSVTSITDASGSKAAEERDSYDAWGKRRNPDATDDSGCTIGSELTRGFTEHEMLNQFCLVNMNGRIYDPGLGLFLSPDPIVPNPYSFSGYLRYTYLNNNPLNGIDPTGHDKGCDKNKPCIPDAHPCYGCSGWVILGGEWDVTGGYNEAEGQQNGWCCFVDWVPNDQSEVDALLAGSDGIGGFGGNEVGGGIPRQNGLLDNGKQCVVSSSSIDEYLTQKDSPMAGEGDDFMLSGQKYNLDPRLMTSLAGAETTFGLHITAGQYNAFNVLYRGMNSPFDSWAGAINSVGHSLRNPKNGYDLSSTSTMYATFCNRLQAGSTCDAGLRNLNQFMHEQHADTNSLAYPCGGGRVRR